VQYVGEQGRRLYDAYATQRAQIGARSGVAVDDPLQGGLPRARTLDVRIAHGVLASIVILSTAPRCRTPRKRAVAD
jgi:hypothetical protein